MTFEEHCKQYFPALFGDEGYQIGEHPWREHWCWDGITVDGLGGRIRCVEDKTIVEVFDWGQNLCRVHSPTDGTVTEEECRDGIIVFIKQRYARKTR